MKAVEYVSIDTVELLEVHWKRTQKDRGPEVRASKD